MCLSAAASPLYARRRSLGCVLVGGDIRTLAMAAAPLCARCRVHLCGDRDGILLHALDGGVAAHGKADSSICSSAASPRTRRDTGRAASPQTGRRTPPHARRRCLRARGGACGLGKPSSRARRRSSSASASPVLAEGHPVLLLVASSARPRAPLPSPARRLARRTRRRPPRHLVPHDAAFFHLPGVELLDLSARIAGSVVVRP
jgi:hypothetical protein